MPRTELFTLKHSFAYTLVMLYLPLMLVVCPVKKAGKDSGGDGQKGFITAVTWSALKEAGVGTTAAKAQRIELS